MRKIGKIEERCLQIILDDYESNYDAFLLTSRKSTIEVKRLAIEIFKKLNNER